ncbi:hypothetical protein ACWD6P_26480 [Streptomyces sp. NPDC002446]
MTESRNAAGGDRKKRKPVITSADVSGASIATLVATVGFNLGAGTWPGRICMLSSPWLVLVLPWLVAVLMDVGDAKLKNWQYMLRRKQLIKLAESIQSPSHKKKLLTSAHEADLEHAERIIESMRGAAPDVSES